jgi:hypothetical protein
MAALIDSKKIHDVTHPKSRQADLPGSSTYDTIPPLAEPEASPDVHALALIPPSRHINGFGVMPAR